MQMKNLVFEKLDQKGQNPHHGGRIQIMKSNEVYVEALLSGDLYKVKMKS